MTDGAPTCDVLLITSRRLADDDHGAGVRTARVAAVLGERYRVAVVQPRAAGAEEVAGTIGYAPAPLDLRLATSPAATEGASIWRAMRAEMPRMTATRAPVVVWADAVVASAGLGHVLPHSQQVVEFANLESRRYLAMALDGSWKRRLYALLEAVKAVGWQGRVARRADAVVALALSDARALSTTGPKLLVRNGLDPLEEEPRPSRGTTVLAVGSWWYGPNRHGMRRFLRRDWPRIVAAVPEARLRIAGRGGEDLGVDLPTGAELLGFVDDLDALYAEAALVLAPARSGGGSQLKLTGALAHGRIVVGPRFLARERTPETPAGALQADDDMARTIVRLLRDPVERHDVERRILAWTRAATWRRTTEPLTRFIDRALRGAG